jgi:hypothetical protein
MESIYQTYRRYMAVKKKVSPQVDSFIDKGAEVKAIKESGFKNILVRIPTSILNSLDEWIDHKPWINRTQWIVGAIHEKLKSDCNEENA